MIAFRHACAQLGISEKDVYDNSNGKEAEEEVGEVENALLELQTDEVEDTTVDDEEVIEVFVEGESDSSDDEEELVDEEVMMSKTMIWLQPQVVFVPMPARRLQRNITNVAPRAIALPQSEKKVLNVCLVKKFSELSFFTHVVVV